MFLRPSSNVEPQPVLFRFMLQKDLRRVVAAEVACWGLDAMSLDELDSMVRQRDVLAKVAHVGRELVGFALWRVKNDRLRILHMASAPFDGCQHSKKSVFLALIRHAEQAVKSHKKLKVVDIPVSDRSLEDHLTLKKLGYRCVQIMKPGEPGVDTNDWVYVFEKTPESGDLAEGAAGLRSCRF